MLTLSALKEKGKNVSDALTVKPVREIIARERKNLKKLLTTKIFRRIIDKND